LQSGQSAPVDGLLFSMDEAKRLKVDLLELDYLREDKKQLEAYIDMQKSQINKFQSNVTELERQKGVLLQENQKVYSNRLMENGLFFILGVILTGSIVYVSK
jgi:ABC-type tungstate transport system permease subunit